MACSQKVFNSDIGAFKDMKRILKGNPRLRGTAQGRTNMGWEAFLRLMCRPGGRGVAGAHWAANKSARLFGPELVHSGQAVGNSPGTGEPRWVGKENKVMGVHFLAGDTWPGIRVLVSGGLGK